MSKGNREALIMREPGPPGVVAPWEKWGTVLLKKLTVTYPENKLPFNP